MSNGRPSPGQGNPLKKMSNLRGSLLVNIFLDTQKLPVALCSCILLNKDYSWIADQRHAHEKSICQRTVRVTYDTSETTVGKLSARRIQIYPDYFCLGIIFKGILNKFQNNA